VSVLFSLYRLISYPCKNYNYANQNNYSSFTERIKKVFTCSEKLAKCQFHRVSLFLNLPPNLTRWRLSRKWATTQSLFHQSLTTLTMVNGSSYRKWDWFCSISLVRWHSIEKPDCKPKYFSCHVPAFKALSNDSMGNENDLNKNVRLSWYSWVASDVTGGHVGGTEQKKVQLYLLFRAPTWLPRFCYSIPKGMVANEE